MAKDNKKTNPIGVRFTKSVLEKLKEEEKIETPQRALNFLEDNYMNKFELKKPDEKALQEIERLKSLARMSETLQKRQKPADLPAEVKNRPLTQEDMTPPKINDLTKPDVIGRHPLWKPNDPKEGSGGFFLKYGVSSYDELAKNQ